MTAALVAKIQEAIGAKWSPEQIGIRLKEKGIFIIEVDPVLRPKVL